MKSVKQKLDAAKKERQRRKDLAAKFAAKFKKGKKDKKQK